MPITLSLIPMAKVRIYRISAQLEGHFHLSPILLRSLTVNRAGGLLFHLPADGPPHGCWTAR
jgi:hypothetical protein